jgi:hypothetical protein
VDLRPSPLSEGAIGELTIVKAIDTGGDPDARVQALRLRGWR